MTVFNGTAADDTLNGDNTNDTLNGLAGDDTLYGNDGNDILNGGSDTWLAVGGGGNGDYLYGGEGDDTYQFAVGSGHDTVNEEWNGRGGMDKLVFTGLNIADVSFQQLSSNSWTDLKVTINATGESVTIQNTFSSDANYNIESFVFTNATLTLDDVKALITIGTSGDDILSGWLGNNDTLSGLAGDDILYGLDGNDTLNGGADTWKIDGTGGAGDYLVGGSGDDTFQFSTGSGHDIINEYGDGSGSYGGTDKLVFTGLNIATVSFQKVDTKDVKVMINATGESVTIQNQLSSDTGYTIESFVFNDGILTASQIKAYVNHVNVAPKGAVAIAGTLQSGQILSATNTVADADGLGNITYQWQGSTNGTLWGNISTGNNLTLLSAQVGKQIRAVASYVDGYGHAETVASAATTVVASSGSTISLSAYDDSYTGNAVAELVYGFEGDDEIYGLAGNDTLIGGADDDFLSGGSGNDVLYAGVTTGLTATDGINKLKGGSGNDTLYSGGDNDVLNGGGGIDTASYALATAAISVDLSVDTRQKTGGAGRDTLYDIENVIGGSANDVLSGDEGANLMDGGLGLDSLIGGLGNDTYIVDNIGDTVTETSTLATEIDVINSSVTYTLPVNVENLTLTGTAALNGIGNAQVNTLIGNNANNILDGLAGVDTLIGGLGSDTYAVDETLDVVTETSTLVTEIDTVNSSAATYTLPVNVENLTLTGTAAINGTGNAQANTLTGNDANNVLDGLAGADTLIGGLGNDTYVVDNGGDVVTETSTLATEIDTVNSAITYTLPVNVENLTLTGIAAINGTGNTLANTLTGNSANNVLVGGTGNDTYVVDNAGDTVTETSTLATEIDTINSSVTYSLGANVENLTLTGTAATNATGNALNNVLTGNAGNNVLWGNAGVDTMIGGLGNDSYGVDNVSDVVTEAAAGGTDTVYSTVSRTLDINVENLTLTGTAAINGIGNVQANILIGNSGTNILDGGAGNDSLTGGTGQDIFRLSDLSNDTIKDFSVVDDTIQLTKGSVFTALALGNLGAGNFVVNTAVDANDYLIYNNVTGALFYDANGNGAGAATQIALLGTGLALTSADFMVV